ncbi:GNAT family N-acetyltransferase [Macrococcus equipercicus]|uniref:N-acetyltransferase n=1 Tax=Macrococcus equipercicus TaxID=69967 RepID=A0A9Q9F1J9_9STAP|nr:GNAT family N-acetyltransferase [Macrococcus equipercicus]UTH13436.1 N-acetyltransferase [Macrococcus equipercicus]
MDIKQGDNRFYIDEGSSFKAEITFVPQGDTLVIDHTFVDPSLRGQGVAKQLVDRVVAYARQENKKILPVCSYAMIVMERDLSTHDVLKR